MFAKLQKIREESEKGFTLVELLVVILIIGILSAIAIPAFLNQRKEAADAQVKSDMRTVAIYMETWKTKNPDAAYPRMAHNWTNAKGVVEAYDWPSNDLKISNGTGIITSDTGESEKWFGGASSQSGEGFCIEGQSSGSNYSVPGNGKRLWYSSLKGGFVNNCKLS